MDLRDLPVRLDELIDYTRARQPTGGPLQHLTNAVLLSEHLDEVAGHLVGHFVDQARRAGASWAEIGQAMGVSKQAAQQRFVSRGALDESESAAMDASGYERFTDRARLVVSTARDQAQASGHDQVGSLHLLLGLVADQVSLAARAIEAQGAVLEQVRGAARAALGPGGEPAADPVTYSTDAKKALQLAFREALRLGHNYIGTEHILLGILRDEKAPAAQVLTGLGMTRSGAEQWIKAALEGARRGRAAG